jgi:hypothetical protein
MDECIMRGKVLQAPQQLGRLALHSGLNQESDFALVEKLLRAFQSGRTIGEKGLLQFVPE